MIKVGMNLLLWSDNATYAEHKRLLDYCKEVGFDGVEFNVGIVSDPEECRKFGEHAKALGLDVTTVGTFDPGVCNPVSPDPALRAAVYPEFKRFIDLTVALGGTLICGPLYQGLGYFSGARPTKEEWDWSIQTMRPCFEYAREKGITVAVEPLNRFEAYLVNTTADGVKYIQDIGLDNVGLLVDTMHANIEELKMPEAFRAALPYIFDVFKDGGYDGSLTIEAFNLGAPSLMGALHLWRTFAPSDDLLAKEGHDYIREMLK